MSALTLHLPADVLARVQHEAARDGATVAEFVTRAVLTNLRVRVPMAERGSRRRVVCRGCDKLRVHHARGYCHTCASWAYAQGRRVPRRIVQCRVCEQDKPHMAHGLCNACYLRQQRAGRRWCRGCQSYQQEFARGLCGACYHRERRTTQRAALERAG